MTEATLLVGGNVFHTTKGAKSELGTASDHLVIYYDPNDFDAARETIKRSVRLHNFAKECKAGTLPLAKIEV
jgi:G:T/U-mismatch repair DNA glycosylase